MSGADVLTRYFDALRAHDPEAMGTCWAPGGIERQVGQRELTAPEGVREFFRRTARIRAGANRRRRVLAPVYCHPAERAATESGPTHREHWDRSKLDPRSRTVLWRLNARWDGGAVEIAGTVNEGDIYTVDPASGRKQPASVPHPAFNQDTEQARASIRKLAMLGPTSVWARHTDPVTGDVQAQLEDAASAPV